MARTNAQQVADRALELFTKRLGAFCKDNAAHLAMADDCITDAYLERARKSTNPKYLPSTKAVEYEFYNLTS